MGGAFQTEGTAGAEAFNRNVLPTSPVGAFPRAVPGMRFSGVW